LRHVSEDIRASSNLAAYSVCPRIKFYPGNRYVSEVNFRVLLGPADKKQMVC